MKKITSLKDYYLSVPETKLVRMRLIRDSFLASTIGVKETFKYKMPAFEKGENWVALANQKNDISVYFCSENLITGIKNKYPE